MCAVLPLLVHSPDVIIRSRKIEKKGEEKREGERKSSFQIAFCLSVVAEIAGGGAHA